MFEAVCSWWPCAWCAVAAHQLNCTAQHPNPSFIGISSVVARSGCLVCCSCQECPQCVTVLCRVLPWHVLCCHVLLQHWCCAQVVSAGLCHQGPAGHTQEQGQGGAAQGIPRACHQGWQCVDQAQVTQQQQSLVGLQQHSGLMEAQHSSSLVLAVWSGSSVLLTQAVQEHFFSLQSHAAAPQLRWMVARRWQVVPHAEPCQHHMRLLLCWLSNAATCRSNFASRCKIGAAMCNHAPHKLGAASAAMASAFCWPLLAEVGLASSCNMGH